MNVLPLRRPWSFLACLIGLAAGTATAQGETPFDFRLTGENAGDTFSYNVAPAGDTDGDGHTDVLVGAWGVDGGGGCCSGRVYLLLGPFTGEGAAGVAGRSVVQVGGRPVAVSAVGLPSRFALSGVYPNPARGAAVVRVDLPARAEVTVRLYDVLGRGVLVSSPGVLEAGPSRASALDVSRLPPGVYVYRVEAALGGEIEQASGRLTVVR